MTKTNLDSLTTKMAKDKGYSGESPAKDGISGFVCPRANAYGGREGIIPPGVAAQHGLVPRGMRQINVSDTAKAANAARDDGKTEAERYREYYGSRQEVVPHGTAAEEARSRQQDDRPAADTADPYPEAGRDVTEEPDRTGGDGGGMFSNTPAPADESDTLDGFYAGLEGSGFGTEERGRPAKKRAEAPPSARPPSRTAPTDNAPAAVYALQILDAQNRELRSEVDRLRKENSDLRAASSEAENRLRDFSARSSETVRIVLGAPERRIKVGSSRWECNVVGSLHFSRTGNSVILAISDTAYASELLAEIRNGPVVLLTETGRTSCTYSGNCAKIYGDAGVQDFISCFRFENAVSQQ